MNIFCFETTNMSFFFKPGNVAKNIFIIYGSYKIPATEETMRLYLIYSQVCKKPFKRFMISEMLHPVIRTSEVKMTVLEGW